MASARASATKPSTGISLGAVGRLDPGAREQRQRIGAERFQALAQHLAALAEGGLGDALERAAVAGERVLARRQADQGRRHLGRRHEGAGGDVEQDARIAAPSGEHRQAAVALGAGLGDDAPGHLALEHQHQTVVPGRPRLEREPGDQQRGGDVVGQVGDDPYRSVGEEGARIEIEGVGRYDLEAAGIALGDLGERADGALVALDRDHAAGAGRDERAGEPARPRPDLDHVHAVERTGRAGDARREIEIEQEVLAERFLGGETVPADDLAQRRQVVHGAHAWRASGGVSTRAESLAASPSAAIRLPGSARPVPAMSKAVP